MLLFLLLSLFILNLPSLPVSWSRYDHKQGQVTVEESQRTPPHAAAEVGAADFAGDTFPFVLTVTQHSVTDVGSRAAVHSRCKPTPWPVVFITKLADLFSSACKPCAVYAVCAHYIASSPLVSDRYFSCMALISHAIFFVFGNKPLQYTVRWYRWNCTKRSLSLLCFENLNWKSSDAQKCINSLGFVEVVYLLCLSFKPQMIKYLYFWTLTISLNKLDQKLYGFHFCGDMLISTHPKSESMNQ